MKKQEKLSMINLLLNEKKDAKITIKNKPRIFSRKEANKARRFHMSFDNYKVTPFYSLDTLAKSLGVKKIFIKDESNRFNLNSFKVLGGSYAITRLICQKMRKNISKVDFKYIKENLSNKISNIPFITATDGNHGRGIAWAANQLGQKAVVCLPKNSAKRRIEAIKETGAEAIVTDLNYDDTVLFAINKAKELKGYIIQDTAWDGYSNVPIWIMQGYLTMGMEIIDQLALLGYQAPTHIFLQAGVGGMAAAILGLFVNIYKDKYPKTIIVEPNAANCFYNSAKINDGKAHSVEGDLETIMVGLACGVPNPVAWPIIKSFSEMFVSCSDSVAAKGVRILGNPLKKDNKIISGESGAAGIGAFSVLMRNEFNEIQKILNINEDSIILFLNTEGDTDPVSYAKILWDGKYRI